MSPHHRQQPPSTPPPHHQLTNAHKPTSLPELLFTTAISFLCLFSSSCSSAPLSSCPTAKLPFLSLPTNPRRFLRIPVMSLAKPSSPDHGHRHSRHQFATPQCLSDWLKPRLPSDSFAAWGVKPGTKNVHNLWLELAEGETSLLADTTPPIRSLNVVTARILGPNGTVLVESRQELSDGSVRDRCRPLSEKMKPGENPEEAAFRAIREELGSVLMDSGVIRIVPGSYMEKVEERGSVSYPGLPARYVLHSVDVVVEGLPEGEFSTEEAEEYGDSEEKRAADKAVSVKKHYWKWVSADSVES
ncbi:hypothetical protein Tsubulata_011112 [Turnera subulata]|uniref:Nudix hydrolase domain-containing protein n=1 Tax=Turnera subulata TaxID=218843 RepID=A0A9Q0FG75_9ROSI|nr:hypothetical protein Tsubulata_011112 [Turnera subulata]